MAVRKDLSRPADVDRPQLTSLQEKRTPGFLMIRQFHRLIRRHHPADHQPVEVREQGMDVARREDMGDVKRVAQFLRGHPDEILRTRRAADGVMNHAPQLGKNRSPRQEFANSLESGTFVLPVNPLSPALGKKCFAPPHFHFLPRCSCAKSYHPRM